MDENLYDAELEAAVLGSLIINPETMTQTGLAEQDFFIVRHRWLYRAMLTLKEKGLAVDIISLTTELENLGKLNEMGGPAYMAKLISGEYYAYNVNSYANQLQDLTRRRAVLAAARELVQVALNRTEPMHDKQAQIIDGLIKTATTAGAVHIGQWADETYAGIMDNMERGLPPVIKTGFADLDFALGGLDPHEGTMLLLTGEPGQGKTILLSNIAENMQAQEPGAIYSLEMKQKRMMMRSFSAKTGISAWEMRSGRLSQEAFSDLGGRLHEYHAMRLYVSDRSELDTMALAADLARLRYEFGIRWYALDYMTLLTDGEGVLKGWERAAYLSKKLLRINRRLGLASIIIHTLTKSGEVAGDIGAQYDADVILKLTKSSNETFTGEFEAKELHVSKNRDGELPLGVVNLMKHAKRPLFVNATQKSIHLNGKTNGVITR